MMTCLAVDLSFNNIERIEGLGSLQSLQDLSLSHNRIKVIEELDNLHSLQVFSIGYNFIESVENVSRGLMCVCAK